MKADYITYKRAASVSIGGLILQVLLAAALLIYGLVGRDQAFLTASIFAGVGVIAWLTLAIVFDQHRRERVEAMEADALASSSLAGTSVFSSGTDDFRPAQRRLTVLHKFFVPGVSLLIGGILTGMGIWRYNAARLTLAPEDFTAPMHQGWALGLGFGIAIVGFIFARYAAGMAKHLPWANLRAGASFAIGTAILGFGLGVSAFVDLIGPDTASRYAQIVVPVFLILIGVETFFNFLLGIYRPRKAGEIPRPAFDSRLLGLLAAPDRIAQSISDAINYQLGFDVTSGWFYQLISRALVPLIVFGMVVVWLISSVAVIRPHQRGMILRFGAIVHEDVPPGFHFKLPWPIDSVYIPEYLSRDSRGKSIVTDLTVTGLRTIELGSAPPATREPILWTNDHAGDELFQLVRTSPYGSGSMQQKSPLQATAKAPPTSAEPSEADMSDFSMISVEMPLQYVVSNVRLYDELGPPVQRDQILKAAAQRSIVQFFQTVTLDDVLGGNRMELTLLIRQRLDAAFKQLNPGPDGVPRGAGVEIVHFAITGVHPPKETANAFESPVQADQKYLANLESARAEEIRSLTQVVGNVALAREIVAELDKLDQLRDQKANDAALIEQEFKVQRALEGASGSAAAVLATAQADRWNRHMTIRGIAARHQGRVALFAASPTVFKSSVYFSTMQSIMKDARLYIAPEKGLIIDYDLKDKDFGQDIFRNDTIGSGG